MHAASTLKTSAILVQFQKFRLILYFTFWQSTDDDIACLKNSNSNQWLRNSNSYRVLYFETEHHLFQFLIYPFGITFSPIKTCLYARAHNPTISVFSVFFSICPMSVSNGYYITCTTVDANFVFSRRCSEHRCEQCDKSYANTTSLDFHLQTHKEFADI